jgi:hypothetical protein
VLAFVLALPAAARLADDNVTVKVGQTVPLKTVFDKKRTYTIVMSGLITRTLIDGVGKIVYDPFHGAQGENCQNAGPSVYFQIKDARGGLIDYADAGRPRCRSDHRYVFQVNDAYPPIWDLEGAAKAYITLGEAPGWTTSGSFKLSIEAEPPKPVAIVIFGANAKKRKGLVGAAQLTGRGRLETTEIKEGGLADTARLFPVETVLSGAPEFRYSEEPRDRHLTVQVTSGELIMQGAAGSKAERLSLRLIVEVVTSNKPSCPARSKTRRGARGKLTLIYYPRGAPDSFVNTVIDLPCGVDESWTDQDSDATILVQRLKKK